MKGEAMSAPVLKAVTNNSKCVAVVSQISWQARSDGSPIGQVTGGCLIGTGTSRSDLNLDLYFPTGGGDLLLGTCRGLFRLYLKGPIYVGAATRFEFKADAGIDGNDQREISLGFSNALGWSLEITADGMLTAEPKFTF
jgi:hypothetical protein